MGRKRTKHTDLPKYMHFYRNAYYYKRSNVRIRLGSDRKTAFMKYGEITSSSNPNKTFADIAVRYRLEVLPDKKPSTQRSENFALNEAIKVFGCMLPCDLRPSDIYQYMDIRKKTSISMANKTVSALSNICNSAIRWGLMESNPCKHIKKIPEPPRKRLIQPEELIVFKLLCPEPLQDAIDLAFITGARRGELLSLTWADATDVGLRLYDSKNDKRYLILWSEKLKALLKTIKAHSMKKRVSSTAILSNLSDRAMSGTGFSSMWTRAMDKAIRNKVLKEKFTFHDIRAMAITHTNNKDGLDAAAQLAGHASSTLTKRVYIRGETKRKPTE